MLFIGVEVEQETSAPPYKKNPGSAPGKYTRSSYKLIIDLSRWKKNLKKFKHDRESNHSLCDERT